jgi:hypothetical protein
MQWFKARQSAGKISSGKVWQTCLKLKLNSMVWVRERTIPTERPPLDRRSDCQLVRIEGATWSAWLIPPAVFSRFSKQEPLLFYQVAPQLYSRGWVHPVPDPLLFCTNSPYTFKIRQFPVHLTFRWWIGQRQKVLRESTHCFRNLYSVTDNCISLSQKTSISFLTGCSLYLSRTGLLIVFTMKLTPWLESVSELYRPSERRETYE